MDFGLVVKKKTNLLIGILQCMILKKRVFYRQLKKLHLSNVFSLWGYSKVRMPTRGGGSYHKTNKNKQREGYSAKSERTFCKKYQQAQSCTLFLIIKVPPTVPCCFIKCFELIIFFSLIVLSQFDSSITNQTFVKNIACSCYRGEVFNQEKRTYSKHGGGDGCPKKNEKEEGGG